MLIARHHFAPIVLLLAALTFTNQAAAQPKVLSVQNAADFSNNLAPGAQVSIFGSGFTSSALAASSVPLPTSLGGVSVQASDGTTTALAPLYYVSSNQINAQLPYGLQGAALTVTVTSGDGQSAPVTFFTLIPNAPKFFTLSNDGTGFLMATHADNTMVSATAPVHPGETIVLYMNSLGAVNPPVAAGQAPSNGVSGPLNRVVAPVAAAIDGFSGTVSYAGLTPGFPGLYQVSLQTPYDDKFGDASIVVSAGSASTQSKVTLPVEANGLYFVITASKTVNGSTFNGLPGATSDLAFRHNNLSTFGANGLGAWTKSTGFSSAFAPVAGVALTLKNGDATAYDNNGIETGTTGSYYSSLPGYDVLFSMSNLSSPSNSANTVQGVFSGYFRLTSATTLNQMIGYFEGPQNVTPSFDPANVYNTYHMNVFSSVSGAPKETGNFVGDVFSSNSTPGTFAVSRTIVDRIASDGTRIPIYRLVYTLRNPLTLPAGDYWFSHDVSTPASAGVGTTSEPITENRRTVRPLSNKKSFNAAEAVKTW